MPILFLSRKQLASIKGCTMKSGILPLCHLVVCQAFSLLLGHRAFVFLSVLVRQVAELKAKVWGEVSSAPGEGPETKKTPG